jgi:TM2 domain-containing membrane protein YozV
MYFITVLNMNESRSYLVAQQTSGAAAAMSFIIPGTGQIFNGRYLVGVFWMILTLYLWRTCGVVGCICHLLSAYTAYRFSEQERS